MKKFAIVVATFLALIGATSVAQAQTWNGQQDNHHGNQMQVPNANWGYQNSAQYNWPQQQYQVPYYNQGNYNQGNYNQGFYNQGHHGNNQGWGNNNQGWGNNRHHNGNGNRGYNRHH